MSSSFLNSPDRGLVSIVLPTFNERENIETTINRIFLSIPAPVEVIIVDDNSPDQTWHFVSELKDERIVLIRRAHTRGLASAFLRGIMEARGSIIGWMDADTCMPPEELPPMIEKLSDHDMVIGSRYAPGGSDNRHKLRVTASRLINGFAGIVLGYGIKDYDSGFVVVRRSIFDRAIPIPTGYGEYFIEFVYHCCARGARVYEHPYHFTDRVYGVSKSFPSLLGFLLLGSKYVLRIITARLNGAD
ncbi:MAG: glycosyltransferase [Alphaproteobacteria bacterium]|nr:glycosyltransferase [Alphaproteobacteria bacterium]